ncbi:JmjC domain protein [Aspergillus spinulosporus]
MKLQKWLICSNLRVRPQWPSRILPRSSHHKGFKSSAHSHYYKPLQVLEDANIEKFREQFFVPEFPVILPRRSFRDLPAYERWFHHSATKPQLNIEYLAAHGGDALVPLELTQPEQSISKSEDPGLSFRKFHAPLSLFLQWIREAESSSQSQSRLYLAQCQLLDLPQILRDDFPTPTMVAKAGKGDVYDTNIWIGYPPTYTPLHRDPNPNLFVQLAGRKIVRLLGPRDGQAVFSHVRGKLGRSGSRQAAAFRGEEMMQGRERALLEQVIWDDTGKGQGSEGFEAELDGGDGLFIPKGWWHSIKGTGESLTASVNWWFR